MRSYVPRPPGPFTCETCGVVFPRVPGMRREPRFCSIACKNRHLNARRHRGDRKPSKTRRDQRDRAMAGLTEKQRLILLAKWRGQGRRCFYCDGPAETVDHVIPLIRGGDNFEGNLVPACRRCNASKCDFLLVEWRRRSVPGATVQRLARSWREPRPLRTPRKRGPEVQTALGVCPICGALFAASNRGRCCGSVCSRELNGREIRDRYRAAHNIPVDPTEPTAYWKRLTAREVA